MIKPFYLAVLALAFASCNSGNYYFNKRIGHRGTAEIITDQAMEVQQQVSPVEIKDNVPFLRDGIKNKVEKPAKEEPSQYTAQALQPDSVGRRVIQDKNGNFKVVAIKEMNEETKATFWAGAGAALVTAFVVVLATGAGFGQALLVLMGVFILLLLVVSSIIDLRTAYRN